MIVNKYFNLLIFEMFHFMLVCFVNNFSSFVDDDEPYSPGEDDLYSPEDNQAESILVNPEIQRNLEEVNRMIEQKRQQIQSIAQAAATQVNVF